MDINNNLKLVKARITEAAEKSGRDPGEITLVGVSKRISNVLIVEGIQSGLVDLGENYAQEFRDKYEILNPDHSEIIWHFIGHLQKNKIKYVIGKSALFHSLNSVSLAEEIDKRAGILGIKVNMLIEINTSGEKTKTGITIDESDKLLEKSQQFNNISIRGFMTMAPYFEDPQDARPYFRKLKDYRDDIITAHPDAKELSMGMSGDFDVAVEEGSTIVRVGTAIFGERRKKDN